MNKITDISIPLWLKYKITKAPIPLEDLKEYFSNKELQFIINYKISDLKEEKLLTYLSNLDVPCDVHFKDCSIDEKMTLIKAYFNTRMLVHIKSLEVTALLIVLLNKGIDNTSMYSNKMLSKNQMEDFIKNNRDIINRWTTAIASGSVYNLTTINDNSIKKLAEDFEIVDDADYCGINYVKLYNYESVYELFPLVEGKKYFVRQFTEAMFKGVPMFNYWNVPNNIIATMTKAIASGNMDSDKYFKLKNSAIENVLTV